MLKEAVPIEPCSFSKKIKFSIIGLWLKIQWQLHKSLKKKENLTAIRHLLPLKQDLMLYSKSREHSQFSAGTETVPFIIIIYINFTAFVLFCFKNFYFSLSIPSYDSICFVQKFGLLSKFCYLHILSFLSPFMKKKPCFIIITLS